MSYQFNLSSKSSRSRGGNSSYQGSQAGGTSNRRHVIPHTSHLDQDNGINMLNEVDVAQSRS
jgi:hypothetical protein